MKAIRNFFAGILRFIGRLASSIVFLLPVYMGLRRRFMRWGATDAEVAEHLPGDQIVPDPRYQSTRAITINVPPEAVWGWIAQLGQGRGGLYSYAWLENLFGCDIHNTDRIMPELQDLNIGDTIRLVPQDYPAPLFMQVALVNPHRVLVLVGEGEREQAVAQGYPYPSWAFVLAPTGNNATRLIVRWRSYYKRTPSSFFWNQVITEPIHFIMERKMLLGIKERAEKAAQQVSPPKLHRAA